MTIQMIFLLLAGIPLLGFLVSVALVLSARRSRDLSVDDWQYETADTGPEHARLMIFVIFSGTKVLYGLVQAFYLSLCAGYFGGGVTTASLPVNLSFYIICAAVNFVAAVLDGFLCAGLIKKRTLTTTEGFRRAFIKFALVEFFAVLGLLFSFLTMLGIVPFV